MNRKSLDLKSPTPPSEPSVIDWLVVDLLFLSTHVAKVGERENLKKLYKISKKSIRKFFDLEAQSGKSPVTC